MSNFISNHIEDNDDLVIGQIYILSPIFGRYIKYSDKLSDFKGMYKYLGLKIIYSGDKSCDDIKILSFERLKNKYVLNLLYQYENLLLLKDDEYDLTPWQYSFFDSSGNKHDYNFNINIELFYHKNINSRDFEDYKHPEDSSYVEICIYETNKDIINRVQPTMWALLENIIDEIKSI